MTCFKVFRRASEFIRHVKEHIDINGTKKAYMDRICEELKRQVDKQLATLLANPTTRKRSWEEADIGGPTQADRPVNWLSRGIEPLDAFHTAQIDEVVSDVPSTTSLPTANPPIPEAVPFVPVNPPTDMEMASISVSADDVYDAPVFWCMNFAKFPDSLSDELSLSMQ